VKIRKKAFVLFVFASLILTTLAIAPVSAPTTATISAPYLYNPALTPGSSFSIEITVENVEELWGFEFVLSFDDTVLTATDVEPLSGFGVNPFTTEEEIGDDYVFVAYTRLFGDTVGFSTVDPAPVARIYFDVLAISVTLLDLHDTVLANIYGQIVDHAALEGGFVNMRVSLWAKLVSVKERHMDVCTTQTIKGLVTNKGEEGAYVRARFVILDAGHMVVGVADSDELWIGPGTSDWVTATWHVEEQGSYYVKGVTQFSGDGINWVDYSPQFEGLLGGLGSFRNVKPSWFKAA